MNLEHNPVTHPNTQPLALENYFQKFRENTIGNEHYFSTNYGQKKLLYTDWIASGRLYRPIEDIICNIVGPNFANTHSFSSESGKITTYTYRAAREIIKKHVNANADDILVTTGTGMTGALSKLIRIMQFQKNTVPTKMSQIPENDIPVVFISHMEHHSNQVPWMESIADVVILPPEEDLLINPEILEEKLQEYKDRSIKIGAFTACSNVTGIISPYHQLAKKMHAYGGFSFVDFAASAPYEPMNMHPEDPEQHLDAIFFSPHKFLGGPGSCGVLLFNKKLYRNRCPDSPGGGNVKWTNPWGKYKYFEDTETREDGGTPGILQVIRTALCIRLKEEMGTDKIKAREKELLSQFFDRCKKIPEISVYGNLDAERIGCVSFNIQDVHYNLVVRLLNDRFGVQVRGGWSCASSYGHYLFGIDKLRSSQITKAIDGSNLTEKPGWVRVSLHPTMTNAEVHFICDALEEIIKNHKEWEKDYTYNKKNNEFESVLAEKNIEEEVKCIFEL